ncbi:hypothetical protein LTR99_000411 [Exophiala xenobiotica]|uniref:Heterokaryon incompatibility domain-containing protein n=1 Tax=Vermiconidia calcicola TaxID=1690605 RepID=A0AAV9QKK7_9PEZI|nr:hypothetical protein LTR41_001180 [Exophiala xenobiotica]KAK5543760.1 hypothetical protein LTR25_001375 [Vermiconidia calcicola]KAK5548438.1 hypothetical protein LTR23_001568 [Chaetothyriales sp. CCFEE 6169]KAK5274328.1 hypothetical protein LTR96_000929 [Exophiala xenobiotica]KAK5307440.1 hypothetical protein LTR99_000411 [Exophiala xenobiotica]
MSAHPPRPDESTEDDFCNGPFCQLIKNFQVPAEERDLRRHFTDLLIANGAQNIYGKGGIVIGSKDEVLSRDRDRCPFCRFVRGAGGKFAPKLLTHPGRKGDDLFVVQVSAPRTDAERGKDEFLWLRVLAAGDPGGQPIGSLMLPGEQVVLVTRTAEGGSRTGRVVAADGPDYARMKRWLDICDTSPVHRGVCTGSSRSAGTDDAGLKAQAEEKRRAATLPRLRVVDVTEMRLVDISWQQRYVALSYVWGGANPPKLIKSQLVSYSAPGALEELVPSMPNTIQDLFTFTKNMGLRYLWFDSLCLVQDDPVDLLRGIMNMELVYESSYVTLIAADTASANTGIPGVGGALSRSRLTQDRQLLKPGLEIMRVHSVDRHLRRSRWNTRGWTLQEYYLSRRTITFVNNQTYFRCRQRTWYEELWSDLEPELPRGQDLDVLTFARDSMDLGLRDVATYTFLFQVLEIYQGRDLTDENDALSAMAGMLGRVAGSAKTKIVQGLPTDIFPLALLFLHTGTEGARTAPRRRKKFPSWSWAGWKGEVSWYPFDRLDLMNAADEDNDFNEDRVLEKALERSSWVTYYTTTTSVQSTDGHELEHQQAIEMIWTPAREGQQQLGSDGMVTVDAGDAGLDLFRALPDDVAGLISELNFNLNLNLDSAGAGDVKTQTQTPNPKLPRNGDGTNIIRGLRDYPLLTFHTLTAHYRLRTISDGGGDEVEEDSSDDRDEADADAERPTFAEYESRTYEICGRGRDDDEEDYYCGVLYADERLSMLQEDNIEKFVVLGQCYKVEFPLEFDAYCEDVSDEPVFWVMLVRLVDGVWERRGIGQVLQRCLVNAFEPEPRWERIVLG